MRPTQADVIMSPVNSTNEHQVVSSEIQTMNSSLRTDCLNHEGGMDADTKHVLFSDPAQPCPTR